ncbi:MAG: DNA polymerase/3'-5' exonuclease PolX [Acidobacteria bacterium]|nr:MAG: DNA polymerase/3'-5' exonuclease PolX [Acidobacteriota bacterium]
MENRDLAAMFEEMADILEIKGENPFRIRSFRRVADILHGLDFNVASTVMENPDKLRAIPGIGEGTMRKIGEVVAVGRCEEHERLRAEIPASMLPLLRLQGLGPKRIHLIWESLRISTLDELEAAARDQKLRTVPGIGAKTEGTILNAIADYRRAQGRFRLDQALEAGAPLLAFLRDEPSIVRLETAGSIRRRRETIGDIDILVTTAEPRKAIDHFLRYPGIRSVLGSGETKTSITISKGLQADLRVLEEKSFGAALQYFTGSKEHNVVLRERAKRRGLKVSEYGVFRVDDDQKIGGETEEEVYQLLDLQPIPPELRENRGEIERAENGTLPKLIEESDIRGDLHMHTTASDGRDTVEAMTQAALARGYEYVAITDHSKALSMVGGLDEEAVLRHCREIDLLNERTRHVRILKGMEVDILGEGQLDLSNEVLAELDVVIASVHSHFSMPSARMTERICRALENPYVNILAHPTGRLILRREPYAFELKEVFQAAIQNRVILELNSYPDRLDLKDTHCRLAKEMGALISINTDSHAGSMLRFMRYGIATARRGWLEAEDVVNTYPLARLRTILKKEAYR